RGADRGSRRVSGTGAAERPPGERVPEVIVALAYPDPEPALALVAALPPGTWYKIGLELFTRAGPPIVERLVGEGRHVFLDLKLHDIPNTVGGATRAAAALGVRLLTVHAAGGERMLRAAADAAAEVAEAGAGEAGRTRLLAITVLTSLDDAGLSAVMGRGSTVEDAAGRLAGLARESGVDGVVSSVAECRAIKIACGADFLVVTPGIRLAGQSAQDQRRVATPALARAAGADYLVVGRAVTGAPDPAVALRRVRADVASATPEGPAA
ncbi:MAG TPA: orotidine-5'-phosphate decarboxylase, partial [Longimicrobiales bacterium]|nr:orotidine-5'-phosphate decarboxylase [Longimicrobiales bacterium]